MLRLSVFRYGFLSCGGSAAAFLSATVALGCYIWVVSKPLTWCTICGTFFLQQRGAKACSTMCKKEMKRRNANARTAQNPVIAECVVCGADFRKVRGAKTCSLSECLAGMERRRSQRQAAKVRERRASDPSYRDHLRRQSRESQRRLRQNDTYRIAQNNRIYEWRARKALEKIGLSVD